MKVVLDTNVLLISLPKRSPYRAIFNGVLNGDYELVLSNEIVMEYEEILTQQINAAIAQNVVKLLLSLPNVVFQNVYYRWNLVVNDPDDNKFTDCAIAAGAKYIVTEDKHFSTIRQEDLFTIEILKSDDFLKII